MMETMQDGTTRDTSATSLLTSYQVQALEAYACRVDVRHVLEELLTDLLQKQPQDPLPYMIEWLQQKQGQKLEAAP